MSASGLEQRLAAAARAAGADLCVLYGSRSAGRGRPGADADVALSFRQLPPPEQRLVVVGRMQSAAGSVPADVLFLHGGTDPVLRFEVFRSGRALYEARPGLMVEGRVRALMAYEDALLLRRIRRAKLRQIRTDTL